MNRDLSLVAIALMTWGIGEGMFLLFQPLYLEELGADPLIIGFIIGGIGIAMAIGHLPAGYLADRLGRRPILFAAWGLGVISTGLMALANSLTLFVIGSAIYGLTMFVMAPLSSYVTAARGKLGVGRALTLTSAAYNVGAFLGPLLGGWIGQQIGLRFNFLFAAIIFIISTIVILNIKPQPIEKQTGGTWQHSPKQLLNPKFIRYMAVIFIVMLSLYLPQPLSQNFLQNERGLNLSNIGLLISLRSAGIVILNILIGFLQVPLGFILSQVCVALFSLLIWLGNDLPWYMLGYFMMGGYQTAKVLASAQTRDLVDVANMGLAFGTIETVNASALIIGPPFAGFLYAQNPEYVYIFSFFLICSGILVTLVFSPARIQPRILFHNQGANHVNNE